MNLRKLLSLRGTPDAAHGADARRVALWGTAEGDIGRSLAAADNRFLLVLDPTESDSGTHGRLAGGGPYDLVVDEAIPSPSPTVRFRASFLHLRRHGVYRVIGDPQAVAELADLLRRLADDPAADPALAGALGEVTSSRGVLEVTRRGRTLAKLREPEMNVALSVDPSRGRILTSIAGAGFTSRCDFRASDAQVAPRLASRYDAPELFLREYADVVCRPKSVVEQRGLLTPDTFRHHPRPRLRHKQLRDAGPGFALAPKLPADLESLDGVYFHLDNEHRGFFGHALTEQLSRLWAWQQAKERHPELRVLVSVNRGRPVADWELVLMEAAGIPRSDVEVISAPVRVGRLLAATPMFAMPDYVHPRITETWDLIGRALRSGATAREYPRRIFCSRRHDKRECLNRADVEALFESFGFTVVFPEDLPLPDQVELFHRADVIGGFAGSGMFTTLFSDRPKHLVVVAPDTYNPSNEYMIAAVRGHRLDRVIGRTPAVLPDGVSPDKPLRWPFSVDMGNEGRWLRDVLTSL